MHRTPSAMSSSVEQWHCIKEISSATKPPQEKPPTKRTAKRVADTMIEHKTREYWMIRVPGRNPNGVIVALEAVRAQYSEHWDDIFKTVTTDNGSEFSMLSELEELSKTLVYFAHPYASCEKGSVERHNGLIRRFIPKGKRIDSYTDEQIAQIEIWCNSLPRKLLGYCTPDDLFEDELDRIYACVA